MHVAPLVLELQHQGAFSAGTCLNAPEYVTATSLNKQHFVFMQITTHVGQR